MAYLVDSNVIINYLAEIFDSTILSRLDKIIDTDFNHSIITFIEVMGYNGEPEIMGKFREIFASGNRLYLDDATVEETIRIPKIAKIKLPDAIIAATAIVHNYELLTENINDFSNIQGLRISSPKNL